MLGDNVTSGTTLITGATGYIGQRLAMHLAEQGESVHVLVRNQNARQILNHPNIRFFEGDLLHPDAVKAAVQGCTNVYHVAGLARLTHKDPTLFYKINVEGTRNLLEAAVTAHAENLVYTSSAGVLGPSLHKPMRESDPRTIGYDNDYEVSKLLAEKLVTEYNKNGFKTTIVAPSRVYGPGIATYSNGVNRFISRFLKRSFSFIPLRNDATSNYAFIEDVIRGHIQALNSGRGGEKYILGGENVVFSDFIRIIRECNQNKGWFIKIPKSVIKAAAFGVQLKGIVMNESPEVTPKVIDRLFQNFCFSSDKAIAELGYEITPFEEGIRQTILHLRNGRHG